MALVNDNNNNNNSNIAIQQALEPEFFSSNAINK